MRRRRCAVLALAAALGAALLHSALFLRFQLSNAWTSSPPSTVHTSNEPPMLLPLPPPPPPQPSPFVAPPVPPAKHPPAEHLPAKRPAPGRWNRVSNSSRNASWKSRNYADARARRANTGNRSATVQARSSPHMMAPSMGTAAFRPEQMDLEAGVKMGSLCDSSRNGRGGRMRRCAVAADVLDELDRASADGGAAMAAGASSDAETVHALWTGGGVGAPVRAPGSAGGTCLFTSLTDAYVIGHEVCMASLLATTPALLEGRVPLYVLGQALSAESEARVLAAYPHTVWVVPHHAAPRKDVRRVTKFALNKEKALALFGLSRASCAAVIKLDTGLLTWPMRAPMSPNEPQWVPMSPK